MRKLLYIFFIVLLISACTNETENPYSVFKKEYRTRETVEEYEENNIRGFQILKFDVEYNGHAKGYVYWRSEKWEKDQLISDLEFVHPYKYSQHGKVIVVDYEMKNVPYDTIISYGDSLRYREETYFYYGKIDNN